MKITTAIRSFQQIWTRHRQRLLVGAGKVCKTCENSLAKMRQMDPFQSKPTTRQLDLNISSTNGTKHTAESQVCIVKAVHAQQQFAPRDQKWHRKGTITLEDRSRSFECRPASERKCSWQIFRPILYTCVDAGCIMWQARQPWGRVPSGPNVTGVSASTPRRIRS